MSLVIDPAVFGTPDPEPPDDPWGELDPFNPDEHGGDGASVEDQRLAFEVDRQLLRMRAGKIARELDAAETMPQQPVDAGTLADILARGKPQEYRVEGLQPAEGRLLISAQRKTGKTPAGLNYANACIRAAVPRPVRHYTHRRPCRVP